MAEATEETEATGGTEATESLTKEEIFIQKRAFLTKSIDLTNTDLSEAMLGVMLLESTQFDEIQELRGLEKKRTFVETIEKRIVTDGDLQTFIDTLNQAGHAHVVRGLFGTGETSNCAAVVPEKQEDEDQEEDGEEDSSSDEDDDEYWKIPKKITVDFSKLFYSDSDD